MDWIGSIQKIIDYIEDNIDAELDSDILAAKIYTSTFYFQRMFTILCDCTVGEYIRRYKYRLLKKYMSNRFTKLDIKRKDIYFLLC